MKFQFFKENSWFDMADAFVPMMNRTVVQHEWQERGWTYQYRAGEGYFLFIRRSAV